MQNPAFAFFDVDGTLIRIKSMFSFHDFWYRHWLPKVDPAASQEGEDISAILRTLERNGAPREIINRRYYEFFAGRSVSQVAECAAAWFDQVKRMPGLFIDEAVEEMNRLRQAGVEPVLVSGSFMEILAPLAAMLDVHHILGTRLVSCGSHYTGKILPPQTIGAGKAVAASQFLAERGSKSMLGFWRRYFRSPDAGVGRQWRGGGRRCGTGDSCCVKRAQNHSAYLSKARFCPTLRGLPETPFSSRCGVAHEKFSLPVKEMMRRHFSFAPCLAWKPGFLEAG